MGWNAGKTDLRTRPGRVLGLWLVLWSCFMTAGTSATEAGPAPNSGETWETRGELWSIQSDAWEVVGLLRVNLPGAKNQVELVRNAGGDFAYLIRRPGSENDRLLTPGEFHNILTYERPGLFWLWRFFNISGVGGLLWVGLGLFGQILFAGRMVVQWITSEREKRSVVPVVFWWMSLAGASMLLVYFLWRRDVIGVLGQAMGWMIYLRNLWLIYRNSSSSGASTTADSL